MSQWKRVQGAHPKFMRSRWEEWKR
jgi:hypothetical protein